MMQFTKTIFSLSTIFIEKKRVENLLWAKSEFLWAKINFSKGRCELNHHVTHCRLQYNMLYAF